MSRIPNESDTRKQRFGCATYGFFLIVPIATNNILPNKLIAEI